LNAKVRAACIIVCTALMVLAAGAHAQGAPPANGTSCTPAGTVIQIKGSQGDVTATGKGADPGDSTVCIRVSIGPGAGANYGKEVKAIFGWYSLSILTSGQQDKIRSAVGPVLTGQSDQASFDITVTRAGISGVWTNSQTWKRVGQEQITVDGHAVNTIRLQYHDLGQAGSNWDAMWDLWYDPIRHIWMKTQMRSPGGPLRSSSEVISVTPP
jgi:hypothetical protein